VQQKLNNLGGGKKMNYIYSALLLHSAKKEINEENVKKIVSAVEQPDDAKVKALVAALDGVNIEDVISKAAMPVAVAAPVAGSAPAAEKKEDKPSEEEQEKKAEEAAAGLSALFG
jgi:large subunit ribosomal protein L12